MVCYIHGWYILFWHQLHRCACVHYLLSYVQQVCMHTSCTPVASYLSIPTKVQVRKTEYIILPWLMKNGRKVKMALKAAITSLRECLWNFLMFIHWMWWHVVYRKSILPAEIAGRLQKVMSFVVILLSKTDWVTSGELSSVLLYSLKIGLIHSLATCGVKWLALVPKYYYPDHQPIANVLHKSVSVTIIVPLIWQIQIDLDYICLSHNKYDLLQVWCIKVTVRL